MPRPVEFLGTAEIEEKYGIPNYRVIRFMKRGLWPDTIAPLKCGLVFRAENVERAVTRLRRSGDLT